MRPLRVLGGLLLAGLLVACVPPYPVPREFQASVEAVPPDLQARMTGVTWRPGCPVGFADLRLVTVSYIDDNRQVQDGQLVVHADAADAMVRVFRRLFELRFPVHRIALADEVGGDDDELTRQNITSAFNCRTVEGSSTLSQHAYGRAIDVNPCVNPWVRRDGTVKLPECRPYADRRRTDVPGMIKAGDGVVQAFAEVGWGWGGAWRSSKDYQHFSANGR